MHSYKLTRRGKIVITMFFILLSIISIVSIKRIAMASDNSFNASLEKAVEISKSSVNVYSNDSDKFVKNVIEYNDNFNKLKDNEEKKDNNDFLSINVEESMVYDKSKVAFLTFDDGPSKNITPLILDILDDYNIKATFFVLGNLCDKNGSVLKDIAVRGHAIGIHSYSHNTKELFKNKDNFINEVKMTEDVLKRNIGEKFETRLFRFPGGSFEDYKKQYMDILSDEDYVSVDWNVLTGDGEFLHPTPEMLLERLKATLMDKNNIIILMHDSATKQATAEVLPEAIEYLKSIGYEFAVLK